MNLASINSTLNTASNFFLKKKLDAALDSAGLALNQAEKLDLNNKIVLFENFAMNVKLSCKLKFLFNPSYSRQPSYCLSEAIISFTSECDL